MQQITRVGLALWLAMVLAACTGVTQEGGQPPAAPLTRVRVCTSSSSMLSTMSAYALEHGLFAQHGLNVSLQAIGGGPNATVALIAGEADICEIASPAVVNAALAGEDLVFVAGYGDRLTYWLMVNPEIESADDLRGKSLAVSGPGSGSDTILRMMLETLGLEPDVDVTILSIGGNPERLAAMESGAVAGTVMSLPESARAESMGYRVLLAPTDMNVDYQAAAVTTQRSYLEENRPAVAAYVAAVTEAIARMKADRESATAVMVAELDLDPVADRALLEVAYEQFVIDYLSEKPYPSVPGIQSLIDEARLENPTARELSADNIIDASIVAELDESGFIDRLYGR